MYMHYVSLSYRIIIVYCYGVRHAYNVSPRPPTSAPLPPSLICPFFAIVTCCVHQSRVELSSVESNRPESSYCAAMRLSIKSRKHCTNNNTFIMKWRASLSLSPLPIPQLLMHHMTLIQFKYNPNNVYLFILYCILTFYCTLYQHTNKNQFLSKNKLF